jgi:hypothetical protein
MTCGGGRWAIGRWALGSCLFLALLLQSGESRAADDRDDVVSITFSPFHLFVPMFELQGEVKVVDHFGVSLIGGYGHVSSEIEDADLDGSDLEVDFTVLELGTQLTWYPIRRFRSLQLGAEALWINVSTSSDVGSNNASGYASGLAVGPFAGFKWIVGPGFTGFVQLGVSFMAIHAEASDDTGSSASADESAVGLLLNFNLGWSF